MRVTVFDYGAGNLHSLVKALDGHNIDVRIETDPVRAVATDALVLPGVGAFGLASERLRPGLDAMRNALRDGLPTIGICLGMQLLFYGSDEGAGEGLAVFAGRVTRLKAKRIPQIGWNAVETRRDDSLFERASLSMAYYANSYVCRPDDDAAVTAWSEHDGDRFPAAVRSHNVVGVQFHPEKSSASGVHFLQMFLEDARFARMAP